MKTVRFIINPISGRHPDVAGFISLLERKSGNVDGTEVSYDISQKAGDMRELAIKAVGDKIDLIVAVGGDGSVNEVAGALIGSGSAFGIIPNGSGNGFARHLGISMHADKALDVIFDGQLEKIDYGTLNGVPFFCTAGIGFDAKVGMDYSLSGKRGLLSYSTQTLKNFWTYRPRPYSISIDCQTFQRDATLITVANVNQWGSGFHIAPGASITDGQFDITIVKSIKTIHTLKMLYQIIAYSIGKNIEVETYRSRSIRIECNEPDFFHLDGEPFKWQSRDLTIEMNASSLPVMIPNDIRQI